ncbi:ABC transporter permease [Streptococcus dysgalactiae subsp. dysgalactiae]|uniref:Transport permease protein n=3 Tax=Streptococcus TaxID=1301 RepID=A0AAE9QUW6_STREQ|nr:MULTISPECIES: ABC transporter permease [Streptococcus]ADX24315.1 polysaccharide ABC exporter membrane-spanning protein [Streptococcus dysgalactiae subsp. equisimilis ATCC 12394]KKC19696.1 glycosyl transferase family 9 [Streptococcus dysgalactiae subsp. equisimilis]MBM6513098.1 ABC transporter permease [Streptococcus dysgalactiae subsp. equisimilis]MBM6533205.1 ABC transporter permease [Streptococcus dysgalactiae subsp. equisimilis]MBM6547951.1 ABC transporter permease [Streptococcus dysgala
MNFLTKKNRILLREMVKTDFKLRYQGSFIGHLWSILKPMLLFTIMYLVFVRFLKFDDGTPHYAVSLLLGMVTWNFFTEATNMGMLSIVSRGDLLRKINFPKEIIVISSVVGATINYFINILVVFAFALINGVQPSFGVFILIPLFLELFLFATGVAFILATLFVKYRDMGPIWEVMLQAGMYGTPIIYSITYIIQRGHLGIAKVMMMNPLAQIIQELRHFIVYSGATINWDIFENKFFTLIPIILSLSAFVIGYVIFKRNAKKFAEIL